MADSDSSAVDNSGWLTPRQALSILDKAFQETHLSKTELLERLRGGMVRAAASQITIDGTRMRPNYVNRIPASDWKSIWESNEVFITGDYREGKRKTRRARDSAKCRDREEMGNTR